MSKETFSNMEFGATLVIEKHQHFCKFRYFQKRIVSGWILSEPQKKLFSFPEDDCL